LERSASRIAAVSIIATSLLLITVCYGEVGKVSAQAEPAAKPVPAASENDEPRPYAASPYAGNIDRGLKFLREGNNLSHWECMAVLDFLRRKFGLSDRYNIKTTYTFNDQEWVMKEVVGPWGRMVDPAHKATAPPPFDGDGPDINYLTFNALYCDQNGPPSEYAQRLRQMHDGCREKGGVNDYIVTHVAIAVEWLGENKCLDLSESVKDLRPILADEMAEIINRNGPDCDISYESMALLSYMGQRKRITGEWLDAVAGAQQVNGGWTELHKTGQSFPHPTIFALWTLLEASVPDAPKVGWIPR